MMHVQSQNRDGAPVGTCPHMCPELERYDRELQVKKFAVSDLVSKSLFFSLSLSLSTE